MTNAGFRLRVSNAMSRLSLGCDSRIGNVGIILLKHSECEFGIMMLCFVSFCEITSLADAVEPSVVDGGEEWRLSNTVIAAAPTQSAAE